jgi:hypothetical protein
VAFGLRIDDDYDLSDLHLSFGFVFGSKESQRPQSCRAALSKFNNFRSEAQILVIFIIIIF